MDKQERKEVLGKIYDDYMIDYDQLRVGIPYPDKIKDIY